MRLRWVWVAALHYTCGVQLVGGYCMSQSTSRLRKYYCVQIVIHKRNKCICDTYIENGPKHYILGVHSNIYVIDHPDLLHHILCVGKYSRRTAHFHCGPISLPP